MLRLTDARTLEALSPTVDQVARTERRGAKPQTRLAIVSTYAPRRCGIATFSEDLRTALASAAPDVSVSICAVERDELAFPDEVETVIRTDVADDYRIAARRMAATGVDVVLIQHEYGIFGGPDGAHVLVLAQELTRLGVAYVVTLHTVVSNPSPGQAATVRALSEHAAAVTVFSPTAVRLLADNHIVPESKVVLVPHGAPEVLYAEAAAESPALRAALADAAGRPMVATFGLLGPGKGIETAIEALPSVARQHPEMRYVIAGATHPEQVRLHGERYREGLQQQVIELGLSDNVVFVDDFMSETDLAALLRRTDVYLTPYPNREQISSGTLTFAIAAGSAIVSTDYHYAKDMVRDDMGAVVPVNDPAAIGDALAGLFGDSAALAEARAASALAGQRLSWPAVAGRVARLTKAVQPVRI
jgi:glycosyltransferase involved in cell wall biosynthesis